MSEPEASDEGARSPAPPPSSQKKGTRSLPAVGGEEDGCALCCGPVWQASTRRSSRCSPPVKVYLWERKSGNGEG